MKKCSKCKIEKSIDDFYLSKRISNGRLSQCKSCIAKWRKEYFLKNPDKRKQNNIAVIKWWESHPEKTYSEAALNWRRKNPEKTHIWRKKNQEKNREKNRINSKKRRNTLKGNLSGRMSKAINSALINGKEGRHWEVFVDYTIEELKKNIEKKFLPGMTWENRNLWHLDHIIPISVFNFESPEDIDFKKCWALKNIRPLWATENSKKGAKLNREFQPSLRLALK